MDIIILLAADHHHHGQQHDEEGGRFDAAAGGGRRRADEHQDNAHHLAGGRQIALSNGVETRRAQRDRLKARGHDLFRRAEPVVQGFGIVPFQQAGHQHAEQDQDARHQQHDPGMEGQTAPAAGVQYIENH